MLLQASSLITHGDGLRDRAPAKAFLRWSCAIVASLDLSAVWTKKVFAKLALLQAKLLFNALGEPARQRVAKPLLKLLRGKASLVDEYLAVIKDGVGGAPLGALVHLLVLHLSSAGNAGLLAAHKEALIAQYTKGLLSAPTAPSGAAIRAYDSLAATLTHDELAAAVVPTVQRMLKRSPEAAAPAITALFATSPLDLSRYVATPHAPRDDHERV